MIRIKAVDEQNILEVCKLKAKQDDISTLENYSFCNVLSVAEANYHSEMYPNAIYNNNVLIGFFMYKRTENQADTATIYRFMVDDRFQRNGLEGKALEYVLRGLKIQGVRKVILLIDGANENTKQLCLSLGFHFTGKQDKAGYYYEAAL